MPLATASAPHLPPALATVRFTIKMVDTNDDIVWHERVCQSRDDMARLPKNGAARVEVDLPMWEGWCSTDKPRVGNEAHPEQYVEHCVALCEAAAKYAAQDSCLWVWAADTTIDAAANAQPPPATLAAIRDGGRPVTKWNRSLNPHYGIIGVLGERAFAREFGGRVPAVPGQYGAGDGGHDWLFPNNVTISVKTGDYPLERNRRVLLQKSHAHMSEYVVFATVTDAERTNARLVGWTWTQNIMEYGEVIEPGGHGEPCWAFPHERLKPIDELKGTLRVNWLPGQPMHLPEQIWTALELKGWRMWGSNVPDPRASHPGISRIQTLDRIPASRAEDSATAHYYDPDAY